MLHWKATYIILAIVFGVVGFIGIDERGGIEPARYICGIFVLLLLTFWAIDFYKSRSKS